MTVTVERTQTSFRLTLPDGSRESIPNPEGDYWDRKTAKAALDLLETVCGLDRRRIRFEHLN